MSNTLLWNIIDELKSGEWSFYSVIADEYTDASNLEQLTVCFRWKDDDLHAHEDFTGFYQIPDISANTEKKTYYKTC